jgi:uncharacterized protein
VDKIVEMVEFCHREYPDVRYLSCEQVIDPNYFTTIEVAKDFFDRYFSSFTEAQKRAGNYDINLFSASQGAIRTLRDRFCFNLYCITPYGTLTICPDVSSPKEKGYGEAIFGKVDENGIAFDDKSYEKLTAGNISTYPECKSCWAKWNCGGGCPNQRRVYEFSVFNEVCKFMKRMLRYNLIHELAQKHEKSTGKIFFEDITTTLKNRKS